MTSDQNIVQIVEIDTIDMSGASNDRQLFDMFMKDREESSKSSRKKYSRYVSRFLSYLENHDLSLRTMKKIHFQAFVDHVKETSVSDNVVRDNLIHVKTFLRCACEYGYLRFNVSANLKLPRQPDRRADRMLTEKQVACLLETAKDDSVLAWVLIGFLYASALRVSEACNLCWEDVGWKDSDFGVLLLKNTKSNEEQRVPVESSQLEQLKLLESWNGEDTDEKALVFTHGGGKPISRYYARRIVKRVAESADLPKRTSPHWLRHSHASHAIANGARLDIVQKQLRHTDPKTTSLYVEVNPSEGSGSFLPSFFRNPENR